MRQRSDVIFFLLTKHPERVAECLPPDWGDGWENIFFIESSTLQSRQAFLSGMSYQGKPMHFKLYDDFGYEIPEEARYQPYFGPRCQTCGLRPACNGCSRCGKCENK